MIQGYLFLEASAVDHWGIWLNVIRGSRGHRCSMEPLRAPSHTKSNALMGFFFRRAVWNADNLRVRIT